MNKGISIIICTHNGVDRLGDTIAHIAKLSIPSNISWEVILADNCSTDNTCEFSIAEWKKHNLSHINFKVISEPKPGKLYALQHAIKEAIYEYLIICDDDNWLASDYVDKVFFGLENMSEIAAIGGRGLPITDGIPLPEWFKDYHFAYAVGPQAPKTGVIKSGGILWGAGLATRRSLYLDMYENFPSLLPSSDKNILSAEDTEYCIRLLLKGHHLYYDDSLTYHHFIPDFKLTVEFRDHKLLQGFKNSSGILRKYYPAIKAFIKAKRRPDLWLYFFLTASLRYLLFFSGEKGIKAKDTLFHLLPFWIKSDPISTQIKVFITTPKAIKPKKH